MEESYKIRTQYEGRYTVSDWMTETKAVKQFKKLKANRIDKKIQWCELVYSPIDADEEMIIDSFESNVIDLGIAKLYV